MAGLHRSVNTQPIAVGLSLFHSEWFEPGELENKVLKKPPTHTTTPVP